MKILFTLLIIILKALWYLILGICAMGGLVLVIGAIAYLLSLNTVKDVAAFSIVAIIAYGIGQVIHKEFFKKEPPKEEKPSDDTDLDNYNWED